MTTIIPIAGIALLLAFTAAALYGIAQTILSIREMDKEMLEASLTEMRKLSVDSMIHIKSNSVPEAVQAQAQLLNATEFLEDEEPTEPKPRIVTTAHGEEINLNEYDLI